MVADPTGAAFMLMTPLPRDDVPPAVPPMTLGRVGWHELLAGDGEAAFAFYADQFGWAESSVMDMGPMGNYRLWSAGGEPIGGMMTKPAEHPRPEWNFYFVVDAIDAAAARIVEAGGRITDGPMEVPGEAWIVTATDPQGISFAVVAAAR